MTEEIFALAKALGHVESGDEEALRALCEQAREELLGRLREGVDEARCGGAFPMGAAWLALAGLCAGDAAEGVEGFTAGGLTVRKSGERGALARAARLRGEAERVMGPYLRDEGFSFLGVRG